MDHLWIWLTVFASLMQAVRIAGQKQLNAHVSTMGTTYVRSALGLPVMLVYLIAVMSSTGAKVPASPPDFLLYAALGAMARQRTWSERPLGQYVKFDVDMARVREVFAKVRASGRVELGEIEAREVIEAYGMRLPKSRLARSPDEAAQIASEFGFPVVMKIS